ncbi:GGDEF domain-containing protein [Aureimonas mangrovi]|uniref:GGDEF domain-containing protein n=1 Tax=Aureimonas mangrovi TaxID=2758041 RepID=UPI00163D6896|nr:GGDEF domain-containing protein [Aureimonas mangrovi]
MLGLSPTQSMALIGPSVLLVFSGAFVGAWLLERRHAYLLILAAACVLFSSGAVMQIVQWPPTTAPNAVLSGLSYTLAVVAAAEAILRRSGKSLGLGWQIAGVGGITALLWYFAYVSPHLLTRVYVQNFGYGLILFVAAVKLARVPRTRVVDAALFWTLLLFAIHFFPRTVLTIGWTAPGTVGEFGVSPFWQALQLSMAVLGSALALVLLAAAIADVLDDLRTERDKDRLTGVLNRGGFEDRIRRMTCDPRIDRYALILCDLDHFKRINDTYGHAIGDEVLARFGAILGNLVDPAAVTGRIGGEEFAIVLPRGSTDDALKVASAIRSILAAEAFSSRPTEFRVTASFGVAESQPGLLFEDVFLAADRRLYRAKSEGRDRVIASAEPVASEV